jgi:hypothetical protein
MKRVLLVSIAFPPKNDPECLQVARYIKYMLKSDIAIDVVTSSNPTLHMPYDPSLEQFNSRKIKKIEIPIFETKLTNFLLRKIIPGGIGFPDSKFTFFWQWKKVVRKLETPPEVIYSRSNPISSALMAYKLQQHYKVPWVMHLSDPWMGSPVAQYSKQESNFNEKWERRCFEKAVKISFTTEKTLEFYRRRYPEISGKFFLSPNVFDRETMKDLPLDFNGPLRIVYTGGLAGNRTAAFFLDACAQVWRENKELAKSEIIFAGPIDRNNKKIFRNFGLPFVKHIGSVPYTAALELQQTAHILISIDQPLPDPGSAMFFPSKILDYFLAGRKILALTDPHSSTELILARYNATIIHYSQIDSLKSFLYLALDAFRNKDTAFFKAGKFPVNFSAEENTFKLVSLLQSL